MTEKRKNKLIATIGELNSRVNRIHSILENIQYSYRQGKEVMLISGYDMEVVKDALELYEYIISKTSGIIEESRGLK